MGGARAAVPTDSFRATLYQQENRKKQQPRTSAERNAERNAVAEFPGSREGGDGCGYFH